MAFMGDKRIAFKILVGISLGKKQIWIPRDNDSKQIYVKRNMVLYCSLDLFGWGQEKLAHSC